MTETTRPAARPDDLPAPGTRDADGPRLDRLATALVGLAVAVGIVLRFWPRSSLWLDEALTINISTLPIGEIGDALRRDGHPPLYYVLMHVWTAIGGESDWWVRALSGVISVAGFPLVYLAGRRIALRRGGDALGARRTGMLALAAMAILPYGIRYGAEARMYSLVITLASAGYLLVDDLLLARRVGRGRTLAAAGAALVAAALLWTHYWSMWLLGVVGLLALVAELALTRARPPHRRPVARRRTRRRWGAVPAVGADPAVPGRTDGHPLGGRLRAHRGAHHDRRRAQRRRPPRLRRRAARDARRGGCDRAPVREPRSGATAGDVVELGAPTQPRVRVELLVALATLAVGWATATVSSNTFSARYAAVIFPLLVLAVATGIAVLRSPVGVAGVLATLVVLASWTASGAARTDRTDAGSVATQIIEDRSEVGGPAAIVACPDQLGVALQRALDQGSGDAGLAELDVIPFPAGGDPRFIDWVDYAERNEAADVAEFLADVDDRVPADATVYLVAMPGYQTFEGRCEALIAALSAERNLRSEIEPSDDGEQMGLWILDPAG